MNSLADILTRMEARQSTPFVLRAALAAANTEKANAELADSLSVLFWNKPYLLAEILGMAPIWPCGQTPTELLAICREQQAAQVRAASYRSIALRAAEHALERIIDESARLHIEETLETTHGQ